MPLETKNRLVCTGCSLLCDDIAVDVQFNKIVKVHNACLRGNAKLHFSGDRARLKEAKLDGKAVPHDDAISAAFERIRHAKRVIVTGLANASNGAQHLAFQLARKTGAMIALPGFNMHSAFSRAAREAGWQAFSLGEVINNADLIVFWGANPIDMAPKLVVKTVFSRGRYRQSGKEVKKFVVIDEYPTPTMERADIKIMTPKNGHEAVLEALASALRDAGIIMDTDGGDGPSASPSGDGGMVPALGDLVEAIRYSEYGVMFLGEGVLNEGFLERHPGFLKRLLRVAGELNTHSRFGLLPLDYHYNFAGLALEGLEGEGNPRIIDQGEIPEHVEEGTLIIAIGSDFLGKLPDEGLKRIGSTPVIALDYKETVTTNVASIVIPVSIPGIDTPALVTRMDGAVLVAKAALDRAGGVASDQDVLERLLGDG